MSSEIFSLCLILVSFVKECSVLKALPKGYNGWKKSSVFYNGAKECKNSSTLFCINGTIIAILSPKRTIYLFICQCFWDVIVSKCFNFLKIKVNRTCLPRQYLPLHSFLSRSIFLCTYFCHILFIFRMRKRLKFCCCCHCGHEFL